MPPDMKKYLPLTSTSYSFDNLCILGVFGNSVYLKGQMGYNKECIIKISRNLFMKSLEYWLNDKKEHCEISGDFCGVLGTIRSCDCTPAGTRKISTEYNRKKGRWEWVKLRVFKIRSIDPETDMEHG